MTLAIAGDTITDAGVATVQELIRIADAVDAAVDAKAWPAAERLFFEAVATDFTALSGTPPATITPAELVAAWAANLGASKASFHMRTNHQVHVAGDTATMRSHGYAWNRLEGNGDPLWEVWGLYTHNFTRTGHGWRISGVALDVAAERGNPWVKTTPGH